MFRSPMRDHPQGVCYLLVEVTQFKFTKNAKDPLWLCGSIRLVWGPGVAQWLRHCATSRAIPGSNPGGVGHRDFSRGCPTEPCALGSTQPLKNEYQGFPRGVKAAVA